MAKYPKDAPVERVKKAFQALGFEIVRAGNHISMARENEDGTKTLITMPSHRKIKGSTLRTILTQAKISRDDFLNVYRKG